MLARRSQATAEFRERRASQERRAKVCRFSSAMRASAGKEIKVQYFL